jgi:hypothetical protein
LYNVAFGDLNFTGKTCLPESVRKEIQKLYTKENHHSALLFLLSDKFKDFKVDNTIFEKLFYQRIQY